LNRVELDRVRANVDRVRPTYSWVQRAREVVVIARELRAARGDLVPRPA
jgi:hypothetical protein